MNANQQKKRFSIFLITVLTVMLVITSVFSTVVYADNVTEEVTSDAVSSSDSDKQSSDSKDSEKESKDTSSDSESQNEDKNSENKSDESEEETKKEDSEPYAAPNGIWDKLAVPFGAIIRACYKLIPNYAIALLIFAIIMKVILFPLGIKQQKNMVKQASLKPKEQAIRKKYAGRNDKVTQQTVQEEIMSLYQKENFNPMGGCLPLLLQFPILFALFRVVYNPLRHVTGLSVEQISEIGNRLISNGIATRSDFGLGDISIVKHITPENFHLFSGISDKFQSVSDIPNLTIFNGALDLSATPTLAFNALIIVPIATFVLVYLSMWLTRKLTYQPEMSADMKTSNRIMDFVMPAMSTWFTFMYPAILGLYWIFNNVLGVVQQLVLKKMFPLPVFTEEDYAKAEREYNGKKPKKKKTQGTPKRHPNSLHHIDDDDYDDEVQPKEEKKNKPVQAANTMIENAPLKDEIEHKTKEDGKDDNGKE